MERWSRVISLILCVLTVDSLLFVQAQEEDSASESFFPDTTEKRPCQFREQSVSHGVSFNLDPCTLCTCHNGTTICNIESCPLEAGCKQSEIVTIEEECCPQCPYKMYVEKTSTLMYDDWFAFTEGSSRKVWFGLEIKVHKKLTSQKIRGKNLWRLGAWISPYEDGSGKRFSEKRNILRGKDRSKEYFSVFYHPWDWPNLKYTMDFIGGGCKDYRFFCVQFGLTENPQPVYDLPITLQAVNNKTNRLIDCVPLGECKDPSQSLRLSGDGSGRIDVFMDGHWGTICDENWNTSDAVVVCRQLGFDGESRVLPAGTFQEGSGPIHLNQVDCNGNETKVLDCQYELEHNCEHRNDAGVDCVGLNVTMTDKKGLSLWVIVTILLLLIVVIAVFIIVWRRRTASLKQKSALTSPLLCEIMRDVDPILKSKEIHPSNVELHNELGRGKFGVVYKATVHNLEGTSEAFEAAVKTSNEMADLEERKELVEEMKIMVHLGDHPNILPLLASCSMREPYYLITVCMEYGDLLHFLRKCRKKDNIEKDSTFKVGEKEKLMIALQIAKGMAFVREQRFYHGDLAARNILVGEGLDIKISDFGLSEDLYTKAYKRRAKEQVIPIKWCSLETILHGICSSEADIWSYGIVLYEIYTLGGTPYPGIEGRFLVPQLKKGYRMEQPAHCPNYVYEIMQRCWQEEPSERIKFQEIVEKLDASLVQKTDYVQFFSEDQLMIMADNEKMNIPVPLTGDDVIPTDDHNGDNFAPIHEEDDNINIDDLQEFMMIEWSSNTDGVTIDTSGAKNVYVES